ncbi:MULTISPECIES: hypothetical protein [Streptomyces]|uniref:hypothetical protein n=1 Tax=Streptomyces sp. SYP-A7185 TaxID=3040076 RepID=UPI0038F7A803
MDVHITIAEDAGAAPGASPQGRPRGTDGTGAVDAGAAAAAGAGTGTGAGAPSAAEGVIDGGAAPQWLSELVRLADAGEIARPGEAGATDAGSAAPAPG